MTGPGNMVPNLIGSASRYSRKMAKHSGGMFVFPTPSNPMSYIPSINLGQEISARVDPNAGPGVVLEPRRRTARCGPAAE